MAYRLVMWGRLPPKMLVSEVIGVADRILPMLGDANTCSNSEAKIYTVIIVRGNMAYTYDPRDGKYSIWKDVKETEGEEK